MNLHLKAKFSTTIFFSGLFLPLIMGAQVLEAGLEDNAEVIKLFFGGLGTLEISQTWLLFGIILLMLIAFIIGWFSYDNWLEQVDRRVTVAQRDVKNIIDNIGDDIDELLKNYTKGNPDEGHINQMKILLKNMKNNLEKSRGYIIENIKEIEK